MCYKDIRSLRSTRAQHLSIWTDATLSPTLSLAKAREEKISVQAPSPNYSPT
jgi:hypothetical protein